jgi:hypothetical protein
MLTQFRDASFQFLISIHFHLCQLENNKFTFKCVSWHLQGHKYYWLFCSPSQTGILWCTRSGLGVFQELIAYQETICLAQRCYVSDAQSWNWSTTRIHFRFFDIHNILQRLTKFYNTYLYQLHADIHTTILLCWKCIIALRCFEQWFRNSLKIPKLTFFSKWNYENLCVVSNAGLFSQ